MKTVTVTLTIDTNRAAALKRFAEKVSHDQAMSVLYGHLPRDLRDEQAYQIVNAFTELERALSDAKVSSWPWIETGRVVR